MNNPKETFHRISYVQYPFMILALVFSVELVLNILDQDYEALWNSANRTLIFLGLGVSFSTLQDTTKTQNEISKKVWSDPKKSRIFLGILSFSVVFYIGAGLILLFLFQDTEAQQISLGLIVLGIGLVSMLKGAIEMADHHAAQQEH